MRRARERGATEGRAPERTTGSTARGVALACCGLAIALLALIGMAPAVHAAAPSGGGRAPGGNFADPAVRAIDIDEPAVVRIGTEENASLTLQLCTRSVSLPLSGGTYTVGVLGSGAFISASGDILTADHVVHPPDEVVTEFAADDIATVLDSLGQYDPGCGFQSAGVSPTDIANGLINLKYTAHVTDQRSVVWLSTDYSGILNASKLKDAPSFDATVEAFSAYTADDLALVHVPLNDTPSLAIGSSADVAVEDSLTVIGFPGNGDVTDSANNMLTPSVNNVSVSAIKQNDNGSPLIQVAGNVEHGDSGGPLLNAQGEVVGVVSFGGPDPLGSTSFMRATASAQPLIVGQHIDTTPGHFELAWTQAFDDYAATYPGHWHVAQAKLEALAASYPEFKALAPYLNYAQAAATQEQAEASGTLSSTTLLIAGGAAVALVVLLAVVLILMVRSRGKRKARAMQAAPPGFAPGYPSGFPPPYAAYAGQPPAPFPGAPYSPSYGGAPWPPDGGGPQPVGGYPGAYRAAPPTQPSDRAPHAAPPWGSQNQPEDNWRQPSNPGDVPASAAPATQPSWSWRASEPPSGRDVYNTNGGGGPDAPTGH